MEPSDASVSTSALDPAAKVDLRVGLITLARHHPEADMLYVLEVDLGEKGSTTPQACGQGRTIVSGLVKYYSPEQLVSKKVVIFANMKPRKLRGIESQGMLLAASNTDNGSVAVEVLEAPANSRPGDRVFVAESRAGNDDKASDSASFPELKPLIKKQKIVEGFIKGLALDARIAKYNGCSLKTASGGNITTSTLSTGKIN
ncbi:hypothetical protein GGI12_000452 [Dipsacomyces acuminosporus]|nr:hypothetical protein GGI12_000452 [Dipsacomyces acuminosporus]